MSSWRSQPRASGKCGATSYASQWNFVNGISIRNGGPLCRAQEREQRLVVGRQHRADRSPSGVDVSDRGLPLQVEQRQARRRAASSAASGPPQQRRQRPGHERPSRAALLPTGVAITYAARRPQPVQQHADPKRRVRRLGIASSAASATTTTGHSVANVNGSLPPSGNAIVSSADGERGRGDDDRRAGQRGAEPPLALIGADRARGAAERSEQRRDRAGERGERGERAWRAPARWRWSASIAAIAGSRPNANASRPVNRLRRGRRPEPRRAEPGVGTEVAPRERLEQRRRAVARERRRQLRCEQPPRSAGTARCSRACGGPRTTSCSTGRSPRRGTACARSRCAARSKLGGETIT